MRNLFLLLAGLAALAALALALNLDASSRLKSLVQALQAAEAIRVELTVQRVGGLSESVSLALAKPDKARIETRTTLTVADGETVTVLDKKDNTYVRTPQTQTSLLGLLHPEELMVWRPFFDGSSAMGWGTARDAGVARRAGKELDVVEIKGAPSSGMTATLYLDKAGSWLRQAVFNVTSSGKAETRVLNVTSQSNETQAGLFAFAAPPGAREISEAESAAKSWLTDMEEAKRLSAKLNRTLIGDFYADWCGPCKMLDAQVFGTAEFKKAAKDFVLVKINVDRQPQTAHQYQIEAMPTVVFWTPKHQEIKRFVGFRPLNEVLAEMEAARNVR